MAGKLIAVDVLLNGQKRKFILDSGSPMVILNSKYIEQDSTERKISSVEGVNGKISGMDIEKIDSLDFSGIRMVNQKVITIDLAHLEEDLEFEIHGLIGYCLLYTSDAADE